MDYKNLLIISHNCLSKTGSNGRTLANFLNGWPKEKLAQFFIHTEAPDFEICNQYYCISDKAILDSVIKRKKINGLVEQNDITAKTASDFYCKKNKIKNSAVYLLRELAWRSKLWDMEGLDGWINSFHPEIILVQAGDAAFLFNLAISISRKYNAKIVIYNTEGYYFKKVSYLNENKFSKFLYPILNKHFKRAYKNLVKSSSGEIYNCQLLADDYAKEFNTENKVIMNTSEFTQEAVFYPKQKKIIYAGNLGLNRHKSLIEFANALQRVDSNVAVEVYGNCPNNIVKSELENCNGIRLHDFISYEKLKQKLRESQYLLHIESFDNFYKEDLKYAFSTKIADSLAVGACLFVYAPENMAISQYLKGKNAAVLISNSSEIEQKIKDVFNNEHLSKEISENGRLLALQNHNIKINKEKFQQILLQQGETM